MDQEQARELIRKYQSGLCTPEEKALVETWYGQQLNQLPASEEQPDLDNARTESRRRIFAQIKPQPVYEARLRSTKMIYLATSVAAAMVLGFFWLVKSEIYSSKTGPNEMVSLTTRPGQIASYLLPDSSLITLNGGSNVEYAKDFTSDKREVTIKEGEVFFEVKHDRAKPFTVDASGTRTQVLGTAFSIRAYEQLKNVSVTVSRGKVSVENHPGSTQSQKVLLLPNDQVAVNKQNGKYEQTRVDAVAVMGWMKGILDFNNEDLGTITLLLEKKFNVPIHIDSDNLREQRLTGKFRSNETIDDILGTLGIAGNFKFQHKANEVFISLK